MKLTAEHIAIIEDRPIDAVEDMYADEFGSVDVDLESIRNGLLSSLPGETDPDKLTDVERWIIRDALKQSTASLSLIDYHDFGTGRPVVANENRDEYRRIVKAGRSLAKWLNDGTRFNEE